MSSSRHPHRVAPGLSCHPQKRAANGRAGALARLGWRGAAVVLVSPRRTRADSGRVASVRVQRRPGSVVRAAGRAGSENDREARRHRQRYRRPRQRRHHFQGHPQRRARCALRKAQRPLSLDPPVKFVSVASRNGRYPSDSTIRVDERASIPPLGSMDVRAMTRLVVQASQVKQIPCRFPAMDRSAGTPAPRRITGNLPTSGPPLIGKTARPQRHDECEAAR